MEGPWSSFNQQEIEEVYFQELTAFINKEREIYQVIPSEDNVFRAFNITPYTDIKVVILGQDPSPNREIATGVAFSLPEGLPLHYSDFSINVIFDALEHDNVAFQRPNHGCLKRWAGQGVLLLNSVLTYRSSTNGRNAHRDKGWETFTKKVLSHLSENFKHLVFILWGVRAQECGNNIDRANHLVLEGAHPAARRHEDNLIPAGEFYSHRYFSRTNEYLTLHNKTPIDYQL